MREVLLIFFAFLLLLILSEQKTEYRTAPIRDNVTTPTATIIAMDLPPEVRTKNWGGGSCVHASNVNLLYQMDMLEEAIWWRKNYSGGEYDTRLIKRLESANLSYAYINDENGVDRDRNGITDGEDFLNYCVRTGRGAGIFYKPSHSINAVGMDDRYVYLLDNNNTTYPEANGHYERVNRKDFFPKWRSYGGFAWTLIHQPVPRRPIGAKGNTLGNILAPSGCSDNLCLGTAARVTYGGLPFQYHN